MRIQTAILAGALSLAALPAAAHHSFAMFANDQVQTVAGAVKDFEWVNPHSWLHVETVNAAGKPEEWAFEMGAPQQLSRRGWTQNAVKVGDKISVTFHPMKDGSHGGSEMSVTLPSGAVLGGQGGFFGR
jgi:hypothetical protein